MSVFFYNKVTFEFIKKSFFVLLLVLCNLDVFAMKEKEDRDNEEVKRIKEEEIETDAKILDASKKFKKLKKGSLVLEEGDENIAEGGEEDEESEESEEIVEKKGKKKGIKKNGGEKYVVGKKIKDVIKNGGAILDKEFEEIKETEDFKNRVKTYKELFNCNDKKFKKFLIGLNKDSKEETVLNDFYKRDINACYEMKKPFNTKRAKENAQSLCKKYGSKEKLLGGLLVCSDDSECPKMLPPADGYFLSQWQAVNIFLGFRVDVPDPFLESFCYHRRAFFLLLVPFLYNSFLNYIFEIDDKPSGKFVDGFSFGWRTRYFLKCLSFDVHFNAVSFLLSSLSDCYCLYLFRSMKCSIVGFGVKFYSLLFSSFFFNAVSFCVNFKIDAYFYITINLSYFFRTVADAFFSGYFSIYIRNICENLKGKGDMVPMMAQKNEEVDYSVVNNIKEDELIDEKKKDTAGNQGENLRGGTTFSKK